LSDEDKKIIEEIGFWRYLDYAADRQLKAKGIPNIEGADGDRFSCESCGLPSWAASSGGLKVTVRVKAENKMRRDRSRKVWVCSEDCAWCVLAVAEMGKGSHRWPISLAEFKRQNRGLFLSALGRLDRYETTLSGPHKQRGCKTLIAESGTPVSDSQKRGFRNAKRASGGRPRKHETDAARQRAYRQRKAVAA